MAWSERGCVYVAGVVCLVLSILVFALGSVAPFWRLVNGDPALNASLLHAGLWFHCRGDWTCFTQDYSSDQVYLHVTRGLQLGGLAVLVVCVIMTCVANCRRQHPGPRLDVVTAVLVLLSAIQSASGPLVYLIFTIEDVDDLPHIHYDWAFAVSLGASGLALLSSLLLLLSLPCCWDYCCCCAASGNSKTYTGEAGLNWGEDSSRSESRMATLRREDLARVSGPPYVVSSNDYSHVQDGLPYSLPRSGLRPLPHPPPGESENPYVVSPGQGMYSYPFPAGGEVLDKVYDTPRTVRRMDTPDGHLPSGWSWHEGVDLVLAPSPPWKGRAEEEMFYYNNAAHFSELPEPLDPLHLAEPWPAHGAVPFLFPRVVVRGYYEPGYGYPEYVMGRGHDE
ncbi:hypothetical protein ACOMHN_046355 [Nucella lapillus]